MDLPLVILATISTLHALTPSTNAMNPKLCTVKLDSHWATKTYIPQSSSVYMNCTTQNVGQNAQWSIQLAGRGAVVQFVNKGNINLLYSRGFYNLTDVTENDGNKTIRLFINNTVAEQEGNNGTVVTCLNVNEGTKLSETILVLYDLIPVEVHSSDIRAHPPTVNISWTSNWDLSLQNYNMIVTTNNTPAQIMRIPLDQSQSYHVYEGHSDASPCEVYNFSVTATPGPVGAKYRGDGCSVPSPVLSRMLPSLPDISVISPRYLLEKRSNQVSLTITFLPALTCSMYPVTYYTLDMIKLSNNFTFTNTTENTSFSIYNLQEDSVYSFKIEASNSVGVISGNRTIFYTTDVQNVSIVLLEDNINSAQIRCTFVAGSQAQGCVVVLEDVSNNHKIVFKILKQNMSNFASITSDFEKADSICKYNYTIYAYDIEANGSNGTVAVPIFNNSTTRALEIFCRKHNSPGSFSVKLGDMGLSIFIMSLLALMILVRI